MNQIQMVVRPTPLYLQEDAIIRRLAPRPIGLQRSDYAEKFDANTLFFDVFTSERGVELSGPPLLNLLPHFSRGQIIPNTGPAVHVEIADVDRTQNSFIAVNEIPSTIYVRNEVITTEVPVNPNFLNLFKDKYTLLTLSKNNNLNWIKDWITFYVINHGINSVLIYDNNSDIYDPEDILKKLSTINGLEVVVVVPWPFKYGPQGGTWETNSNAPWDSDFCQHGALSHARRRFLSKAAGVINADIDELVVAETEDGIFDSLQKSSVAVFTYSGQWIEPIRSNVHISPRFSDFRYSDSRRAPCTKKWTASPMRMKNAKQWRTHDIIGAELLDITNFSHRHFMGINSNWKFNRTQNLEYDEKYHNIDINLQAFLQNAASKKPHHVQAPSAGSMLKNVLTTLQDIENTLIMEKLLPEHIGKLWYWKPNNLVFDLNYYGYNLGFDLIQTDKTFELNVIGRNETSKILLQHQMIIRQAVDVTGRGHWRLRCWPRSLPVQEISVGVADFIRIGSGPPSALLQSR